MDERDPQTFAIIGAAMEVHRELGPGFLEAVYQEALAIELTLREIPFGREVLIPIAYKGQPLKATYRADFVCYDQIIVELKAIKALTMVEQAQVINYLKATHLEHGLLINFRSQSLEFRRVALSKNKQEQVKESDEN